MLNTQLLQMASQLQKEAFIDQAAMTGGGGGGAPPADPAAGGAPPMDPAMAGGAPAGGAPAGGGGGDALMGMIQSMQQQIQGLSQGGGAAAGGAGGVEPIKPKIDVNVTLLQILKILARIADSLGIQIPASEMVATSNDVTQFAQQQTQSQQAGPGSAISGISPIQGASPALAAGGGGGEKQSYAFDPSLHALEENVNKADAMRLILSKTQKVA